MALLLGALLIATFAAFATSPAAAQGRGFGRFVPACANQASCGHAELQAAIDAAAAGGGGRVQIPCGDHYLEDATLVVPELVSLEGCSHQSYASSINCHGATCIEITGNYVAIRRLRIQDNAQSSNTRLVRISRRSQFEVEDLMLRCAGTRVAGSVGIELGAAIEGRVSDIQLFGCDTGIRLEDRANANLLDRVTLQSNNVGLEIASGSDPGCRDVTLVNPTIEGNRIGIRLASDCAVSIHGGHFEQAAPSDLPSADIEATAGRLAIFGTRFADPASGQLSIHRRSVGTEYTEPDVFVGGKLSDPVRYDAGALELLDVDLAPEVTLTGDVRRVRGSAAFSECHTVSAPTTASDRALWRAPEETTLLSAWCEVHSGSASIRLLRDDGSPASALRSSLTCTSAGVSGSVDAAEAHFAAGDRLDLDVLSVTGSPPSLTVCASLRYD